MIGNFEPVGVNFFNGSVANGIQTRRRNPKKKVRLPYHAKRHLRLPIMDAKGTTCVHALSRHEDIETTLGDAWKRYTVSYALPCVSKHSSKSVQHRDSTGRKW